MEICLSCLAILSACSTIELKITCIYNLAPIAYTSALIISPSLSLSFVCPKKTGLRFSQRKEKVIIGLLQQTITWYKIRHAGGQAHYFSSTGTLKQRDLNQSSATGLCFNVDSAGIIMNLPSSMADFVPCDRLLQKAYFQNKEPIT